jgi:hypothetical protein
MFLTAFDGTATTTSTRSTRTCGWGARKGHPHDHWDISLFLLAFRAFLPPLNFSLPAAQRYPQLQQTLYDVLNLFGYSNEARNAVKAVLR